MKLTLKPVLSLVVLIAAELAAAGCNHTKARSDAEIAGEIQAKVTADQAVQNKQIGVQAASGVVTLSGAVASEQERGAAAADAASVAGVRTVVNNLSVTPPQPEPQAMAQPASTESEAYAPETRSRSRQDRYERAHERSVDRKPTAAAVRQPKPASTPVPAAQPRTVAMAQRPSQQGYDQQQSNPPQRSNEPQGYDDQQGYDQQEPGNAPPPDAGQQGYAPPPAAAQPAYPPRGPRRSATVTVPAGTAVSVRMVDSVDSKTAQVGDTFRATLNAPIELDGNIVVPADADVVGRVVEVQSRGRFKGEGLLTIELTRLRYNGQSYSITTASWTKELKGRGKGTAAKVGGGAALGAIIGGIAGGGKGAAIGTVVGGGAGAGAQGVDKQKQVELEPETLVTFRLDQPVTVHPASVNERSRGRERLDDR